MATNVRYSPIPPLPIRGSSQTNFVSTNNNLAIEGFCKVVPMSSKERKTIYFWATKTTCFQVGELDYTWGYGAVSVGVSAELKLVLTSPALCSLRHRRPRWRLLRRRVLGLLGLDAVDDNLRAVGTEREVLGGGVLALDREFTERVGVVAHGDLPTVVVERDLPVVVVVRGQEQVERNGGYRAAEPHVLDVPRVHVLQLAVDEEVPSAVEAVVFQGVVCQQDLVRVAVHHERAVQQVVEQLGADAVVLGDVPALDGRHGRVGSVDEVEVHGALPDK